MITFQFLDIFNNLFLSLSIDHSHNTIVFPDYFYHDSGINIPLFLFSFFQSCTNRIALVMSDDIQTIDVIYALEVNDEDYMSHAHQVPWYQSFQFLDI